MSILCPVTSLGGRGAGLDRLCKNNLTWHLPGVCKMNQIVEALQGPHLPLSSPRCLHSVKEKDLKAGRDLFPQGPTASEWQSQDSNL